VDVGVHQDGLVHISALSDTFVKDPRSVVKPGDIVRVKVLEVDKARKRISLTMRMSDPVEKRAGGRDEKRGSLQNSRPQGSDRKAGAQSNQASSGGALADALRRAGMGNSSGKDKSPRR
jgi:uncharacterized protein